MGDHGLPEFASSYQSVGFWGNKAAFLKTTMAAPNEKIADDLCTHATFWLCLQEQISIAEGPKKEELQQLLQRIEPSLTTARQVENVRQTMALLRPLSAS